MATGSTVRWSCSGAAACVAEALTLGERDLDSRRGSLLVRNGKGGRRREVGMGAVARLARRST